MVTKRDLEFMQEALDDLKDAWETGDEELFVRGMECLCGIVEGELFPEDDEGGYEPTPAELEEAYEAFHPNEDED